MSNIEYYSTLLKLYNIAQELYDFYPAYVFREVSFTRTEIICMNLNFTDYLLNQNLYEQRVTEEAVGLMEILNIERVDVQVNDSFEDIKNKYPNST